MSGGTVMASKSIDQEVVQRLAKAFDLAALTGITLLLTLQASHTPYQHTVAGFFACRSFGPLARRRPSAVTKAP